MQKNGYSKDFMRKVTSSTLQHNTENNERRRATKWKTYISVPFIDDSFNNKIRRLFREVSNDIQVVIANKPAPSLRNLLNKRTNITDRPCNKRQCILSSTGKCYLHHVVYEIQCPCGMIYIGSTIRHLHDRIYEHLRDTNSAIKDHGLLCEQFERNRLNISILSRQGNEIDLRISEALWIHRKQPSINRRIEKEESLKLLSSYDIQA
jgi:hypothetical protein